MGKVVTQAFDAVVVGSGPGGASVARALSRGGKRVLILERGQGAPIEGTLRQAATMALVPGHSLFFTPDLLGLVRGLAVGGSSIIAYATAFDPPYAVFDAHGVDLRDDVAAVKQELPIGPLAERLIGPAARRIAAAARDLGFGWTTLPKIADQDKCRPGCDKCLVGCPYGAKWTARAYVEEAQAQGATLLTDAEVKGLDTEDNRVTAVAFDWDGERRRVAAPLVVLAAGGIGTPLVLRASGIESAGRDFFFDPLVIVMGTVEDLDDGREFPMATGFREAEGDYILTDFAWPFWAYSLFTSEVFRFDRLAAHRHTLGVMVKVRDDLGGHLTGWGGVVKRLSTADRARFARGCAEARRILEHAGARHIFRTWYLATHPGGTAKIGEVVDANLKTRLDNLYVCDCSIVPQSWGLPPTLTLLALGKRLGRHLLAA